MVYLHVITSDPPYFLNGFLRGERIDQIHCRFGRVAVLLMAADGAHDAGRIGDILEVSYPSPASFRTFPASVIKYHKIIRYKEEGTLPDG